MPPTAWSGSPVIAKPSWCSHLPRTQSSLSSGSSPFQSHCLFSVPTCLLLPHFLCSCHWTLSCRVVASGSHSSPSISHAVVSRCNYLHLQQSRYKWPSQCGCQTSNFTANFSWGTLSLSLDCEIFLFDWGLPEDPQQSSFLHKTRPSLGTSTTASPLECPRDGAGEAVSVPAQTSALTGFSTPQP